jgi:hypothetical protein
MQREIMRLDILMDSISNVKIKKFDSKKSKTLAF